MIKKDVIFLSRLFLFDLRMQWYCLSVGDMFALQTRYAPSARDMCARRLLLLIKLIDSSAVINLANEEYAHAKYSYHFLKHITETGDWLCKFLSLNLLLKQSRGTHTLRVPRKLTYEIIWSHSRGVQRMQSSGGWGCGRRQSLLPHK